MSLRDIFLFVVILSTIPFILRKPYVGVLVYVWLSVMSPHRLTWGLAYDFPFVITIAIITLISAVVSKDLKPPPPNALLVTLFFFVLWTGLSTIFALDFKDSYERWKTLMKTQLFVFLIPMLIHTKEQLRQLIWVLVLSVAFYGTKGGIFTLLTGGSFRVWGPPGSYIEDNNALAVATIMMIPLMRYLQLTSPFKYVRWGLTGMMLLCAISALGSQSRGALVAVCAMAAVLWWKSTHKLGLTLVAVVAIPLAFFNMPDSWHARMETISNYQEDGSANMRLNSWGTMFNIAKDRPLVGGGFELASRPVYQRYAPDPTFPPQVAHSIYFQAMGEHGFIGLGLYLLVLFLFWWNSRELVRLTRGQPHLVWAREFGLMLQVSLAGFAVGGAFLSLVNYDVPYYLMAATAVTLVLVHKELQQGTASTSSSLGMRSTPRRGIYAGRKSEADSS